MTPPAVLAAEVSKVFPLSNGWAQHRTLKRSLFRRLAGLPPEESPPPFHAVKEVSFQIEPGTTCALIGKNGSGKSTLLRLIAGIYRPSSGSIQTRGKIATIFELGLGFHQEFTGRESVEVSVALLNTPQEEIGRQVSEIIRFADIGPFIEQPMRTYSAGMAMRVGFSVAIHVDPDILLIDEVLAVGDFAFMEKCLRRLRSIQEQGRTIILATHDMNLAESFSHRVLWIQGGAVRMDGDPREVVSAYHASTAQVNH